MLANMKFLILILQFYWSVLVTARNAEPVVKFTDDCTTGTSGFKIHTKSSLKERLNGENIKISLDKTFFKDSIKKRHCLIIDETVKELTANFMNDIPQGEATILYRNNSYLKVSLDENGSPAGILRYYTEKITNQPNILGHTNFPFDTWTRHENFWNYSKWINDSFQLIANENFDKFYACQHVDTKWLLTNSCMKVTKGVFLEEDGFHYFYKHNGAKDITSSNYVDIDLTNWAIYSHSKQKLERQEACQKKSLKDWMKFIANESKPSEFKMADPDLDPNDLLSSFQDISHLTIDLREFSKFPKDSIPRYVIISQGQRHIFTGAFEINRNFEGTIDVSGSNAAFRASPISLNFYLNSMISHEISLPVLTTIGHLCKSGRLCGLVKKYGVRLRDPVCTIFMADRLSYLGYHDPKTGLNKGASFNFLVGSSLLYSQNGAFPSDQVAYIYFGGQTAIYGSFDEHRLLVKGQKVPFEKEGCDENGFPILKFFDPVEPQVFYHYKPPTSTEFGDQPTVPDELATEYLYVKKIDDFKGDGFFAKKEIDGGNTAVALYGGFRGFSEELDETRMEGNPYAHRIGFCPGLTVNIPQGFSDITKYNATMAHKSNNEFEPNLGTSYVDSVRFGLVGMFVTKRNIEKNEELSSFYAYDPDRPVAKWFYDQWLEFKKEHPEASKLKDYTTEQIVKNGQMHTSLP